MSDSTQGDWTDWIGADVVGEDGDKIGSLEQIYVDSASGEPEWLLVKTGLFGTKSSFVPLADAGADGDDLRVPYTKSLVKDAPNVDEDEEGLSPDEEASLYAHYGRDYDAGDGQRAGGDREVDGEGTGHDTSGPDTDGAMTRSEEELEVGKRSVESGRARLRKSVVTENVTATVPLRKEKVRVEREPITDENRDAALKGAEISDEEHEMILNEEEPVVSKQTVAKERVRLDKDVETTEETVTDEVRKEQIELDEDA